MITTTKTTGLLLGMVAIGRWITDTSGLTTATATTAAHLLTAMTEVELEYLQPL